jgi:hypothetical protein
MAECCQMPAGRTTTDQKRIVRTCATIDWIDEAVAAIDG